MMSAKTDRKATTNWTKSNSSDEEQESGLSEMTKSIKEFIVILSVKPFKKCKFHVRKL